LLDLSKVGQLAMSDRQLCQARQSCSTLLRVQHRP